MSFVLGAVILYLAHRADRKHADVLDALETAEASILGFSGHATNNFHIVEVMLPTAKIGILGRGKMFMTRWGQKPS